METETALELERLRGHLERLRERGNLIAREVTQIEEAADEVYRKTFALLDEEIGGEAAGQVATMAKCASIRNSIRAAGY